MPVHFGATEPVAGGAIYENNQLINEVLSAALVKGQAGRRRYTQPS